MSASTLAHPPRHGAALTKFWIAVLFVIAVGVGLAWLGAGSLRGQTTDSGLFIRTVEPGTGPVITNADAVLIDYEGRLADGTLFDSSANHGGPQAVAPAQTIPGFAEALTMMKKGGRYHVRIPSNLAYGSADQPGIPANSDLEFDIHVVDVAPNAAAMAAARQAQQLPQEPQPEQP
ncbi:MAG TPA: FKBP-type peptidyl-prolyl cis-trans isomerase [Sphingomicrobium sp.]|nr:FKBP-type peptidyl-prolyl cis-trans isomerase [Sphingomicrobium sp.]